MIKIPLSYYINLFITEKCIEIYDFENKKVLSEYYRHLAYLRTYFISETTSYPDTIRYTFYGLLKAIEGMYGFGPDLATKFIFNYFRDDKYKNYLDFVITYRQYLEYKN